MSTAASTAAARCMIRNAQETHASVKRMWNALEVKGSTACMQRAMWSAGGRGAQRLHDHAAALTVRNSSVHVTASSSLSLAALCVVRGFSSSPSSSSSSMLLSSGFGNFKKKGSKTVSGENTTSSSSSSSSSSARSSVKTDKKSSNASRKSPETAVGDGGPAGGGGTTTSSSSSSSSRKATSSSSSSNSSTETAGGGGAGAGGGGDGGSGGPGPGMSWLGLGLAGIALPFVLDALSGLRGDAEEISFQAFKTKLMEKGVVEKLEVRNKTTARVFLKPSGGDGQMALGGASAGGAGGSGASSGARVVGQGEHAFYFNIGSVDVFERKLEEAQEELGYDPSEYIPVRYVESTGLSNLLSFLPTAALLGVAALLFMRMGRAGAEGMGGGARGIFNVTKANVTVLDKNAKNRITFVDVAGCDEAKTEIMEFVNFLKDPRRYQEIGASIPKGALLVGPPGTGKTLLAKATAGEANVPFLSISGSDFLELFVGVGPSRVRDLFSQARAKAPSIIFIDEIDAIGRARGRGGLAGGNDERENTLNQLLVEMDGFGTTEGVIMLAATNRPDTLDKALLRPGRFDRQITVDPPDINGRERIFQVHLKKLKLAEKIEYFSQRLAALTPGFSGADIANLCNEAALNAARKEQGAVDMGNFEYAADRVIGGLEKPNLAISPEERKCIAYHEAGHAVAGWFLEHTQPLLKVSIVPRGSGALGFAQYLPNENKILTAQQFDDDICMALGGRVAEQVFLGKISTGAISDLQRVTTLSYNQVKTYGFSDIVGHLSFPADESQSLNKPYSQETAREIDEEVRRMVDRLYTRTVALIEEKRDLVESLALRLLEKEVLQRDDLEEILGVRPFVSEAVSNLDKFRKGFAVSVDEAAGAVTKDAAAAKSGGDDTGSAEKRDTVPSLA